MPARAPAAQALAAAPEGDAATQAFVQASISSQEAPAERPARKTADAKTTETKTAEAAPAEPPKEAAAKPVVKRVRKVAAKTPGDAKPEGGAKDGE